MSYSDEAGMMRDEEDRRNAREQEKRAVEWWSDHNNLADLWKWLDEIGFTPGDGPGYFMEKPWKWNREYDTYLAVVHSKGALNSTPEEIAECRTGMGV